MAALSTYRNLLRAMRIAFQGDDTLLHAARDQARLGFNANRTLLSSDPQAAQQLKHASDVAQVLRQNVVQGRPMEGQEGKYELNLHPEIERGDNHTVKQAAQSLQDGKCCSA